MIRRLLSLVFLTIAAENCVQSQEVLDSARYRAVYSYLYKTRPEQSGFEKTDVMHLDIGLKVTKFYSQLQAIRDSIKNEGLKKDLPPGDIVESTRGYRRGILSIYYQHYEQKKRMETANFIGYPHAYEEAMTMPQWTIHDDTLTVLGYPCHRATARYLGREWEVWFTLDIPQNRGPWKLWGLPGLIAKAYDTEGCFQFELTAFQQMQPAVPIVYIHRTFGNGDYSGEEYRKVSKQAFQKLEKIYHRDATAFINVVIGTNIRTADGSPAPVIRTDYIPLEK